MNVKAVVSFDDHKIGKFIQKGQVLELPEGVDWLKAGLVVPVPGVPVERAVLPEPEISKPVKSTRKGKKKDA